MKNKLRVTVLYKDGTSSCFTGISRIAPSHDGNKIFLLKDLTPEEMKLYDRNPDEDEDFISCTIENAKDVNLFVAVM